MICLHNTHPLKKKNFYKLWISSTNVLINILNNGIVQKSKFLIEEAHLESARYIQTKQFDEVLDILKEKTYACYKLVYSALENYFSQAISTFFTPIKDMRFITLKTQLVRPKLVFAQKNAIFLF